RGTHATRSRRRFSGHHDGLVAAQLPVTRPRIEITSPAGCGNGVDQYRFPKNGDEAQEFSGPSHFTDYPTSDATYQLMVRCSSNPACTTTTGASVQAKVYTGDGADVTLTVTHDRPSGVTTLHWLSRPQPSTMSGYDAFQGTQADDGNSGTPKVPDSSL